MSVQKDTIPSSALQTAQILGLTIASFHAGLQWSLSSLSVPPVLAASTPQEKVRLWKILWDRGAALAPPFAFLATSMLGTAAYLTRDPITKRLYIAAATMPLLMMPFTWYGLGRTNMFLIERKEALVDRREDLRPEDARQIDDGLNMWRDLNYVRAALPAAAAGLAIAGLLL